ncbi:hypothetical protein T4B_3451 [Trichinella pseudospiralis]|uniref:Uncharacterized protein n=1 Tax=Trichinella pseudospiralis TaxID=6337 RepID=A0A0V1II25_TRIPS|nr:hypothetical protein T4B_3451 [Trichinella pseudospiralis]
MYINIIYCSNKCKYKSSQSITFLQTLFIILVLKMKLMYCILVVLLLAFNEAQQIDYVKRAEDALLLWNSHRAQTYKRIINVRDRVISGARIIYKVDLQDTVCLASKVVFPSYYDMVRSCPLMQGSRVQRCALYYDMGDIRTTKVNCESDEEEDSAPQIGMTGGTVKYDVSDQVVQDLIRKGVFEWDKRRNDGKYHLLKYAVEGSRSGILSSFKILLVDASCSVRTGLFDRYQDVYSRCSGRGSPRQCQLEFRYLDETQGANVICKSDMIDDVFNRYEDVYSHCTRRGSPRECVLEFRYLDERNSEVEC